MGKKRLIKNAGDKININFEVILGELLLATLWYKSLLMYIVWYDSNDYDA